MPLSLQRPQRQGQLQNGTVPFSPSSSSCNKEVQEKRRRGGHVISPLYRSFLFLILACCFHGAVYLQSSSRNRNVTTPLQLQEVLARNLFYDFVVGSSFASTQQRPVLLLHVGPTKTASTTIQQFVLGNAAVQAALLADGIRLGSTSFNYVRVQRLRDYCLARGSRAKCRIKTLQNWWDDMRHDVPTTDKNNNNNRSATRIRAVLKSSETYSNLPANDWTTAVFRSLLGASAGGWQVRPVLVYRRISAWLPSAYAQHRKGHLYWSAQGHWESWPVNHTANPGLSFAAWYGARRRHADDVAAAMVATTGAAEDHAAPPPPPPPRDSLATYEYFAHIFGAQSIVVVDMDGHPAGIAASFLCHPALQAPRACRLATRELATAAARNSSSSSSSSGAGGSFMNTNADFLFDHDLLVLEAHRTGWRFRNRKDNGAPYQDDHHPSVDKRIIGTTTTPTSLHDHWMDRHEATLVLQEHLERQNISLRNHSEVPQTCLSPADLAAVWNRTVAAESRLAASPLSVEQLRAVFDADVARRYCTVHAAAVLQNATLRQRIFGSHCLYVKPHHWPQYGCA